MMRKIFWLLLFFCCLHVRAQTITGPVPSITLQNVQGSTQCLQATSTGFVTGTGAACGSGSGGSTHTVTPTIASGSGAGTSPTLSVSSATDFNGFINLTSGSSPSASSTVGTLTFGTAFSSAPGCFVWPSNANTQALAGAAQAQILSSSTTGFVLTQGSTPLSAATSYQWGYACSGLNGSSSAFVFPSSGIPNSNGSGWNTSYQPQGTDSHLLTSGTISGSAASLCTDANGGATTTGCSSGGASLSTANTWSALQTFGTNISIGGVTVTGATGTGNNVFAASPTLTGTPAAPTAAVNTNTTQIATMAAITASYASPPTAGYGSTTPEPVAATTVTATTSVGVNSDGVHAAELTLAGNTTNPTIPANTFGWLGFPSTSATAYYFQPSTTAPVTGQLMTTGTPSGNISQVTYTNPTALTTTAQCLAAAAPITTPCVAYQSGPVTGLTSTYTGSTITLYTTNAPAGAYFEFDITIIENANATGTVGGAPTLTFSAFTPPQLSSGNMNGYSFFNFPFQTQTYTIFDYGSFGVSTKSGTSLAFAMATASGTGTLSWGYDIVVRRLY